MSETIDAEIEATIQDVFRYQVAERRQLECLDRLRDAIRVAMNKAHERGWVEKTCAYAGCSEAALFCKEHP